MNTPLLLSFESTKLQQSTASVAVAISEARNSRRTRMFSCTSACGVYLVGTFTVWRQTELLLTADIKPNIEQRNRRYHSSPAVCNPTPFSIDNRLVQRLQSSVCPYLDHYNSQELNSRLTLYTSLT